MSYILDALRKSQAERQGVTLRTSADESGARAVTQLRRGRWLATMGLALLVVNVLVAAYLYFRKESNQVAPSASLHVAPSATPTSRPVTAQPLPAQSVVAVTSLNSSENVAVSPETDLGATDSFRDIDMEQAYEQQRRTWSRGAPAFAQVAPVAVADKPLTNIDDSLIERRDEANSTLRSATTPETIQLSSNVARQDEKYGALPLFMESTLANDARFAGVKIDVHVYATSPNQRFVLINLKKYHEGETTDAGLTLNAITPEGVVVSYQGQQYKLLPQ